MAKKKTVGPPGRKPSNRTFDSATFERVAADLKSKRMPLERVTYSDNIQRGLRAIIRNTGLISFHVQYPVGDSGERPYLKIGDHPEMSVEVARKLARTVILLGEKGIDPTAGLHERLIKELLEKGEKWRP